MLLRPTVIRSILGMVALLTLAGCPPTATSITVSPPPTTVNTNANEPSITYAATGGTFASPATLVVAYNQFGGNDIFGWSSLNVSTNAWTSCDANTAGCGDTRYGNGPIVPTAPPTAYYPYQQHSATECGWQSDMQVSGGPVGSGLVVFTTLGSSTFYPACKNGPDLVVASISADNGATVAASITVNDQLAPVAEDQPSMTVNRFTGDVLFAWRHKGGSFETDHGAFRVGRLVPSAPPTPPTISWFGAGNQIPGSGNVSGLIVQPGPDQNNGANMPAETAAVVFGFPDWGFNLNANDDFQCGANSPPPGQQEWYFMTTSDGGNTWSAPVSIANTNTFPLCLLSGNVSQGYRNFAFVWNRGLPAWLVTVPISANNLVTFRSTDGVNWSQVNAITSTSSLFFPSLATDDQGLITLTYYEGDSTDQRAIPMMTASNSYGAAGTWATPVTMATPITVTPINNGNASFRTLGDYEGVAMVPNAAGVGGPNAFDAWTSQMSLPTNLSSQVVVEGATVQ